MDRVHRARRHCKSDPHPKKRRRDELDSRQVTDSAGGSFAIEVQTPDGSWTLHTDGAGENIVSDQQQIGIDEILELVSQDGPVGTDGSQASLRFGVAEPLILPNIFPEPSSLHTPDLIPYDQLLGDEDGGVSQAVEFPTQISYSHELQDTTFQAWELTNSSPESGVLAQLPWGTIALEEGLPFERFEGELASKNLRLVTRASSMQDLRLLPGSSKLVTIFLNDAVAAMTNVNQKSIRENFYGASLTLKMLDTILPAPQQRNGHNSMTRLSQEVFEDELCRILLLSTANGFIGMNGIVPLEVIPKFLYCNSNVTALLSRLFRDKPSHVVKGLAENLFRAAIESGDHRAIGFFLTTRLVNVDEIVCFKGNKKYTPIERVAKLQKLEAVHELLRFAPNVNRTFLDDINLFEPYYSLPLDERGALGRLIVGSNPSPFERIHNIFSSKYLDTVDALIKAGAKVRVAFIERALTRFVRMDLAKKLLCESAPADHLEVISSGMLYLITENLTDEEATKSITKILSDCESTGCNQCLSQHSEKMNWAIVIGAKRGHNQFVRTYFQHVKCPTQILAAAIRGGNDELVQFVLAQNPDMHAPASSIDYPPWSRGNRFSLEIDTVPLAEAIDAKDEALVRELEIKGALVHLAKGHGFSLIVSAAAGVGNVEYVKKLMLLNPQFDGNYLNEALVKAIDNKQEDVFRFLLEAGVYFRHYRLNTCELGSASLWSDFVSTYPQIKLELTKSFSESLESGNMDLLNILAQSGMLDGSFLTKFLKAIIEAGDRALLRRLLELGANVFENNGEVLEQAAARDLDILQMLFESVPLSKTHLPRFGTRALVKVIQQNRHDIDALEIFIACKAVDFKSMPLYHSLSPLGAAIAKDVKSCRPDFPLTTRLLDAGCDINGIVCVDEGEYGRTSNKTPLLVAIEEKSKGLVQLLIKRGAQINKEATLGIKRTPIQAASQVGSLDIVEFLLQNGADVNGKPALFRGGTALQFAAIGGYLSIAVFLLDRGADLYAPPSTFGGRWPIEGAAEHGRLDMIQLLWNASLGGFPIEQCRRAVGLAKENGHGACVDLIRELAVSNGIMPTLEGSEEDRAAIGSL